MPCGSRMWPAKSARNIVLISDPGPDPDDVKAILIAGTLHKRGDVNLRLVVANGGGQAERRAQLARCLLDAIGSHAVPVAVGSEGTAYEPAPHEFALPGIDAVDRARLEPDGHGALMGTLESASNGSVYIVCTSSLRDLADAILADQALMLRKVARVVVQAGLTYDEAESSWEPDSSANNELDPDAAAIVYAFCFMYGLPLTVVSRHAVPLLPMQLARSFAERTNSPLMAYLANAQFLGLEGLWQRLCAGKLPARCTKQWYFETFCGVDAAAFEARGLDGLGAEESMLGHLNGFVKPYAVCALMAALPGRLEETFAHVPRADIRRARSTPAAAHALFLTAEHSVGVEPVIALLRNVSHDVVRATASTTTAPSDERRHRIMRRSPPSSAFQRRIASMVEQHDQHELRASQSATNIASRSAERARRGEGGPRGAGPNEDGHEGDGSGVLSPEHMIALLESSVITTRAILAYVTRVAALSGMLLSVFAFGGYAFVSATGRLRGAWAVFGITTVTVASLSQTLIVLALQPTESHRRAATACAVVFVVAVGTTVMTTAPLIPRMLAAEPGSIQFCGTTATDAMYVANGVRLVVYNCVAVYLTLGLAHVWARTWTLAPLPSQTLRIEALWWFSHAALLTMSMPLATFTFSRCIDEGRQGAPDSAAMLPASAVCWLVLVGLLWLYWRPGSRARAHATLTRTACGSAAVSEADRLGVALAPLIGHGKRAPRLLVTQELRALRGAELSPEALRTMQLPTAGSDRSDGRHRGAAMLSWPTAAESGRCWRLRPLLHSLVVQPLRSACRFLAWPSIPSAMSIISPLEHLRWQRYDRRLSITRVDPTADRSLAPERIGAFILHSHQDDPKQRARELQLWARRQHALTGEWPRVWLDAISADPSLDRQQALEHSVIAMCRSARLLCVVGPSFTERLACVGGLLAWRATGGSVEDVEVMVIGGTDEERRSAVAAFDAFHVADTLRSSASASRLDDGLRALLRAVELAGAPLVNAVVRDLLPAVQRSAEEESARESSRLSADEGGSILLIS